MPASGFNAHTWIRLDAANDDPNPNSRPLGWSKYGVPYCKPHNALQTLDIHVPARQLPISYVSSAAVPASSGEPPTGGLAMAAGIWVIYLHGGAWRDPMVTSRSAVPAVRRLFSEEKYSSALSNIAGIASVNYSLSPHPKYPPGSVPDDATDRGNVVGSRTAVHPQHIHDVQAAISFLHSVYNVAKYILVGHSCGATLAFHTIMPQAWKTPASAEQPDGCPLPVAIGGIAGLYDLPTLVHAPGKIHEPVAPIYRSFLIGAFGSDETIWRQLSPTSTCDPASTWPSGIAIFLSASKDDTLVPYTQLEDMHARLQKHWPGKPLLIDHFAGDHNDAHEYGYGVADTIVKLIAVLAS